MGVWKHPVQGMMYSQLSEEQILVKILVFAEKSENLLKLLQERFSDVKGFRINIIPVEASLPVKVMEEESNAEDFHISKEKEKGSFRLSREELYEDIADATKLNRVYVVLVILSAIVAAIGLWNNSVAIIIGAMVIALAEPQILHITSRSTGRYHFSQERPENKFSGSGHCCCYLHSSGLFPRCRSHHP